MVKGISIAASAAALFVLASCYGYRAVTFDRKIAPAGRVPAGEGQAEAPGTKRSAARFTAERQFALMRSASPVAVINDRAVGYALQARYGEAEILLREALAERAAPAAYNNLGILCEINGRRGEAFRHYSAACLGEPDNAVFRSNFTGFADSATGRK